MKKKLSLMAIAFFSLSLFGCGTMEQEQAAENIAPDVRNESSSEMEETYVENDRSDAEFTFPESYNNTLGNVDFKMAVIVDADLAEEPPITAKARMLKVNEDQAFRSLFSGNDNYEVYSYEEKNEYGEKVNTATYVPPPKAIQAYRQTSLSIY